MFDCFLPCFPKERERRAHVRRLQDREAELDARERRIQRLEQAALAAEKTRDAIRSLEAALGAWGGRGGPEGPGGREEWGGDALREARRLLEAPCAKSAASALIVIGEVAQSCDEEVESAVMAAERAMRDVVVLRCQSQDRPWDRTLFLDAAEEAFGQSLGRELQALLLIAFHKIKFRRERQEAMAQAKAKAKPKPRPNRLASQQPTLSEVD